MRILSTITPAFRGLAERWLAPSLDRLGLFDDLVIWLDDAPASAGNGDFRGAGFDHHVISKLRLAASWAQREREPFLITDADIIYLRDFRAEVAQRMATCDLLLAPEWPDRDGYNIGQMIIRPSQRTARFLSSVAEELANSSAGARRGLDLPANQNLLNERLLQSDLRHASLPRTFATTGLLRHASAERLETLYSYHATVTQPQPGLTSVQRKDQRLAEMAERLGLDLPVPAAKLPMVPTERKRRWWQHLLSVRTRSP